MPSVTPLSPLPIVSFTTTLPDNTTVVEANPGPFNNTKEVIFFNLSDTDRVFVKVHSVTNVPVPDGDVDLSNSLVLPPGASVSVCIGSEGNRQPMAHSSFWAAEGDGANLNFVMKAESGTDVEVNISYIQNQGGADGGTV